MPGVPAVSDTHRTGYGNVKQMSENAAAKQGSRLAWLDALRGFAALCVVFDHGSTLLLLPVRSFLYQWLDLGQYGVFVFFLVSGYIVPASLERKGSVRGFWISRGFRLYPMFLVALVLSAVAFETGHGTIANAGRHPLAAVLGWLFMLQNLVAGVNVPNVAWTLTYEMTFYLLLAALFSWGVHRRSGWYASGFAVGAVALGGLFPMAAIGAWANSTGDHATILNGVVDALVFAGLALAVLSRSWQGKIGATLAAVVILVLVAVNQNYPYRWSGCVILALMFTGTLIYRAEQRLLSPGGATPRTPRVSPGGVTPRTPRANKYWLRFSGKPAVAAQVVGILLMLTFAGIWHGARLGHHWQVQWATSVLLAGATFGLALAARRARIPRWCAWLGMISYSVYLLQSIVFDAYRSIPVLHRKHTMPDQVLFFAGLLVVIIGLSALTYYFIEKPMQRLGRRVSARFSYAAETGSGDTAPVPDGPSPAATRSASSSTVVAGGSGASP
jgi:peptidoglycan/LPS O-acetylase OafA/YrhL